VTLLEHVADKIKKLRINAKLTQDDLAKQLKVATNKVSRWETGTYKPDLEDLEQLARYFKVSVLAFFPGEDPATKPELQALLRAAGNLGKDDLEELQRYAEFRQARHLYKNVKPTARVRQ
jgi:transcriptional regulator with XRE-family HTH domain